MITYQQAQKEHLPQMTALWCSVYGDRREYTEAFYAHWFGKCICMTALDGTHIAGILHLLPAVLQRKSLRDTAMQALLHSFRCETLICRIPPDADSAQEKGMICGQHAADTGSVFIPLDLL